MDVLRIRGPARLHGTLSASGSKNAALPIMAATILADRPIALRRVPELTDVNTMALLLGHLGVEVKRGPDGVVRIATVDPSPSEAPYELVRRMRASFCVLGPLVARRGRGVVPLPGGCNLGARPVDLHLKALAALGAEIRIEHGLVFAQAKRLHGAEIDLGGPFGPTVTGTANAMSAATLARGRTILRNAAREPEIVDLGGFLKALGARIEGLGSDVIEIEGVEQLSDADYTIIADRIEAATLLVAAAITRGTVSVVDVCPEHLTSVLAALTEMGADIAHSGRKITLHAGGGLRGVDLVARPYPAIPTDVQAQFMALLSVVRGGGTIRDEVFPERHLHLAELNRLGAGIERRGAKAIAPGGRRLSGARVVASDLRASAALVLAGLAADGETIVERPWHLDRGYERLDAKLNALGAHIERLPASTEGTRVRLETLAMRDRGLPITRAI